MFINDFPFIARLSEKIMGSILNMKGHPPAQNSGYLTIMRRENCRLLLLLEVGNCSEETAERYRVLAVEKAIRLCNNPTDISSFQSRVESCNQYGGAIVAGEYVVSFSGLSEFADETFVLQIALFFHWTTSKEALKVVKISGNKDYGQFEINFHSKD